MIYLIRFESTLHGTKGMLFLPNGWNCYTMEPPWLNNIRSRSCIPAGEYKVEIKESDKYGSVYEVQNVPGRSDILIHSGNYAGDEESDFRSDTDGCILPGSRHGMLDGQEVVLGSRVTLNVLVSILKKDSFNLTVKGEPLIGGKYGS